MGALKRKRAAPSGLKLSAGDAALVKGMLDRGDRQHDIASWFGVNGGRIGEVASGQAFSWVVAAKPEHLPPPGPYPSMKDTTEALAAVVHAEKTLSAVKSLLLSGKA